MLSHLKADGFGGIAHGFFGRTGGVSSGLYSSLNCGLGSKDERASVTENRHRVARALGTTGDRLLTCYQVHSAEAVIVDRSAAPCRVRHLKPLRPRIEETGSRLR